MSDHGTPFDSESALAQERRINEITGKKLSIWNGKRKDQEFEGPGPTMKHKSIHRHFLSYFWDTYWDKIWTTYRYVRASFSEGRPACIIFIFELLTFFGFFGFFLLEGRGQRWSSQFTGLSYYTFVAHNTAIRFGQRTVMYMPVSVKAVLHASYLFLDFLPFLAFLLEGSGPTME